MYNGNIGKNWINKNKDIVILATLNDTPMCGYVVIEHIYKKLGVLLSPGMVYPTLKRLESNKFVKSGWKSRKRIYELTPEGKVMLAEAISEYKKILGFVTIGEGDPLKESKR